MSTCQHVHKPTRPCVLAPILQALEAKGGRLLSPMDREGLHPLLIPLVAEKSASGGPESITCVLRWAQPEQHPVGRCADRRC